MSDTAQQLGIFIKTVLDGKGFDDLTEEQKKYAVEAKKVFDKVAADAKRVEGEWRQSVERMGLSFQTLRNTSALAFAGIVGSVGLAIKAASDAATEMESYGLSVAGFTDVAADYRASLGELELSFKSVGAEIGSVFMPVVRDIINGITPVITTIGRWIDHNRELVKWIAIVGGSVAGIGIVLGTIGVAFVAAAKAVEGFNIALTLLGKNPWLVAITVALMILTPLLVSLGQKFVGAGQSADDASGGFDKIAEASRKAGEEAKRLSEQSKLTNDEVFGPPFQQKVAKATEQVKVYIDTIKALMNAGMAAQEAFNFKGIASIPEQTVLYEQPKREEYGPAVDAWAQYIIDAYQHIEDRAREYRQKQIDGFMEATRFMQVGMSTAIDSMLDSNMKGGQRIQAVWTSMRNVVINQMQQMLWKKLATDSAMAASTEATNSRSLASTIATQAKEMALAIASAAKWLALAAAKAFTWAMSLGPFGLAIGAGAIASMIALIKGIRLQSGGIVGGAGFGDRVPAMLEPGEFVMNRNATSANRGALEAMNRGQTINNGGHTITVNMQGKMNAGEMLSFREQLRMHLVSVLEELNDVRAFRPGILGVAR